MNRKDLQLLARQRLREAHALYSAKEYSGAYYLAGYVIECALKACIAKQVRKYDFPDKKGANDAHTHDLSKLAILANVDADRVSLAKHDVDFRKNWDLITEWSEQTRYRTFSQQVCESFLKAIAEKKHGVLPWIKQYW